MTVWATLANNELSAKLEALPRPAASDYSIYTQELLGKPPAWILRWGSSLVLIILAGMILLAWWIKYPDIVSVKVVVTTPIPPANLVASQNGNLHWLKTGEAQLVKQHELIAVIDSSASYSDVERLQTWLKDYPNHRDNRLYLQNLPQNLKLGDSQIAFAQFQKQLNEWLYFLQAEALAQKIALNQKKQMELEAILGKYQHQTELSAKEGLLLNKTWQRFQSLQKSNLVSAQSVEEKQLAMLNSRRQQEQLSLEASRTRVELANLKAELNELRLADANKRESLQLNLEQSLQALQHSVDQWRKNYLLIAPITGRLVFSRYWGEFQSVKAGEEVVTIVPAEKQDIIAKMKMAPENSGKVKKGQKLLIKLAGYPYQEYGQIISQVNSVSLVPRENLYTVDALLPNPLVTSYHKSLYFHQEMQGQAEIVTEDIALLERIFYQIRKALKQSA